MERVSGKSVLSRRMVVLAVASVLAVTAASLYLAFSPPSLSGDVSERIAAIHKMTVERPRGAGGVLARAAEDDPSPEVRREAVGALGHFIEPQFRPAVVTCTTDQVADVRAMAAGTLGLYGDAEAADVLARMIADDTETRVVQAALGGLADCKAPMAIVALLETAEKNTSTEVRMVAMKSLLRKYEGKVPDGVTPDDEKRWRDLLQRWRRFDRIKDAYATAGVTLVNRPGDIIGHDHHPERRD